MNFDPLFNKIYKGNAEASRLSYCLLSVAHTWDDLIDRDKPVADSDINKAFMDAFFNIPSSPLWDDNIRANLYNVYLRWQDANKIETSTNPTDDQLAMAWMLRAGMYDLFVLIAAKLYGTAWAEEIGPSVRDFYGESLDNFIKEIRHA